MKYLDKLTGFDEKLISDPYFNGGGYHEIKRSGLLKVHADFNKHPDFDIDRRLNLLIYLNDNWQEDWGEELELYDENDMSNPIQKIAPIFNRCVIFTPKVILFMDTHMK